jgi:hypothetical protein
MRGPKQIKRAQGLPPPVPGSGMSGEKTNESRLGVVVARIRLARPNKKPKKAPFLGPITIDPIITGTCIIVAFIPHGSGIKPIGENVITKIMEANIEMMAKSRTLEESFIICGLP